MKRVVKLMAFVGVVAFMALLAGNVAMADHHEKEATPDHDEMMDHDMATPEMDHDGTPMASPMAGHDMDMSGSTGVVYLTFTNNGDEADRLVSAETDAANVVEIHEVSEDDSGVMQMTPLEDGLEIPAGETVVLEPGGYHLMLIGLQQDLEMGESIDIDLVFEQAGEVSIVSSIVMGNDPPEDVADDVTAGDITISVVWSRAAPMMS